MNKKLMSVNYNVAFFNKGNFFPDKVIWRSGDEVDYKGKFEFGNYRRPKIKTHEAIYMRFSDGAWDLRITDDIEKFEAVINVECDKEKNEVIIKIELPDFVKEDIKEVNEEFKLVRMFHPYEHDRAIELYMEERLWEVISDIEYLYRVLDYAIEGSITYNLPYKSHRYVFEIIE